MPISLALRGDSAPSGAEDAAWAQARDVLELADRTFSTYRADSIISRLGRGEIDLDNCPADVHEVLALGETARAASGGAFDVCRTGPDGRPILDPSGVVKGWAIEKASRAFDDRCVVDYCLSAGGDMVCRAAADSDPWQIGIEDPSDPSRVLAVVPIGDGAIATSGFTYRGEHIVDARTGASPAAVAAVTVIGASLTQVDIDATCAFAAGEEALVWLRTRPGCSGLVVWCDGSTDLFGQ